MDAKGTSSVDSGQSDHDSISQGRDTPDLCEKCVQIMTDLSSDSQNLAEWDWRFSTSAIADRYAANLNPTTLIDNARNYRGSSKTGIFIAELGNQCREVIDPDCTLCRLLLASKVETTNREADDHGDELQVFSLQDYFLFNHRGSNPLSSREQKLGEMKFLSVVPANFSPADSEDDRKALEARIASEGCLIINNTESEPTIVNAVPTPPLFQPPVALQWMEFCSKHHNTLCVEDATSAAITIEGFRWIDCETRNVESALSIQPYIALSYVWGPPTPGDSSDPGDQTADQVPLPEKLPTVIEDAINVTKDLGFRYLWVDKYCINQSDLAIKLKQIQQMDLIYQKAEITIIAAAGETQQHGLTGVDGKERASSRGSKVKFKNIEITSTLKDPQGVIQASKWYTRGWTFQEGLLSRRRLIFTDDQVYFECNAMNCFESVSGSLENLSQKDKSRAATFMRPGLFESHRRRTASAVEGQRVRSVEEMDFSALFNSYLIWSQQYSARDLTMDMDSMNAFVGLIHKLEKLPKPILQSWAVPFPDPKHKVDPVDSFAEALSWRHKYNHWDDVPKKPRRRADFPSWSWVGWAGEIIYPTKDESLEEKALGKSVEILNFHKITQMTLDGTAHSSKWTSRKQVHHGVLSSNSPVLTLQSRVLQPADFSYDGKTRQWKVYGYPATVWLSRGPASEEEAFMQLRLGKDWVCVLLGSASSHLTQVVTALILERNEDGTYLRSGVLTLRMPAVSWTGRIMKSAFGDLTRDARKKTSEFQTFVIR